MTTTPRLCVDCGEDLRWRSKKAKRCIPCAHDRHIAQMRAWREANPDRVRELEEQHRKQVSA